MIAAKYLINVFIFCYSDFVSFGSVMAGFRFHSSPALQPFVYVFVVPDSVIRGLDLCRLALLSVIYSGFDSSG